MILLKLFPVILFLLNNVLSQLTTTTDPTTSTNTTANATCDSRCIQSTCQSNGVCGQCQLGYVPINFNTSCISSSNNIVCPLLCKTCAADFDCSSCVNSGDFLLALSDLTPRQCVPCNSTLGVPNCELCQQCNTTTCKSFTAQCLRCKSGFVLSNNLCVASSNQNNCSIYLTDKKVCQQCVLGFFLDSSGICQPCPSKCANCSSSNTCQQCFNGTVMVKTTDTTNVTVAGATTTLTTTGIACVNDSSSTPCQISNCANCNKTTLVHTCLNCTTGFQLQISTSGQKSCFQCNSSFNCQRCLTNSPGSCLVCNAQYFKVFAPGSTSTYSFNDTGYCLTGCPTDGKYPNSDTNITFAKTTNSCIPCPRGWSGCNYTSSGAFIKVGACLPGYVSAINDTTCQLSNTTNCTTTTGSTNCTVCDSLHFLNTTTNQCILKYACSSQIGFYFDVEQNLNVACPQSNCLRCQGPKSNDCLDCVEGFGRIISSNATSSSSSCKSCGSNCGKCVFNTDGSSRCTRCPSGLVSSWNSSNSMICSPQCPQGYYAGIDYAAIFNSNLSLVFNVSICNSTTQTLFSDPVTLKLVELYQNIVPIPRTFDNGTESIFYKVGDNVPAVYSALDSTPIYFNSSASLWQFKFGDIIQPVTLPCVVCKNNCLSCPAQTFKFFFPNGSLICLYQCPVNYVVNVTAGNVCVISVANIVIKISQSTLINGTQSLLTDFKANITSLNNLPIGNITWSFKFAQNCLNPNIPQDSIIGNLTANVTMNQSIFIIPKERFQKYSMTQLILAVDAQSLTNLSQFAHDEITFFIDTGLLLSNFSISPQIGLSANTNFVANYAINPNFKALIGNASVQPHLMCYPSTTGVLSLAANSTRRVLQNTTDPSTSATANNQSNSNGTFTFFSDNQTSVIPNNDLNNLNSNFNPDSDQDQIIQANLARCAIKSNFNVTTIRNNYNPFMLISKYDTGSNGSISFITPFSDKNLTFTCIIFIEFTSSQVPVPSIIDTRNIYVLASNKSLTDVLLSVSNNTNRTASQNISNSSTIDNFNQQATILTSVFLSKQNSTTNSTSSSSNSSFGNLTNQTQAQNFNFTCDKNGSSQICCPPDNKCSGNGKCILTAINSSATLESLNTTILNKKYVCQCNEGFSGINCATNSTDYKVCSQTLNSIIVKLNSNLNFTSEQQTIDFISSLNSLAKTCLNSYSAFNGILSSLCSAFKSCTTKDCIQLSISSLAQLSAQAPFLNISAFATSDAINGSLTTDQLNNAIENKRKFINDSATCFSNMMAFAALISFNSSEINTTVIQQGSISTLLTRSESNTSTFNVTCSNISTSSQCNVQVLPGFLNESTILSISPSSRDQVTDIQGGGSIVSDLITISASLNGTLLEITNSSVPICMEHTILDSSVNTSSIVSFHY